MTWGRALMAALMLATVPLAGCSAADGNDALLQPAEPLRVLLAGDSITIGYYATTTDESFASLLLDEWSAAAEVELTRVEEAGARAWRITRGVEQLAASDPFDVDVVVLEVGANDVGKTTVREYAADYRELVAAAERGTPRLVVCLGPWNDAARTAAYDRVVGRVCDGDGRVHVPLSDLYDTPGMRGPAGAATELSPRDDFHPNDDGHAAIARRVAAVVGG